MAKCDMGMKSSNMGGKRGGAKRGGFGKKESGFGSKLGKGKMGKSGLEGPNK